MAIDLKSFYASVECVARGLDPLAARLVVADPTRTEKTICLAVSPALKAYGIPGRARLFEVVRKARECRFDYVVAPPRMAKYMEISAKIYSIYLKYIAPEDLYAYSIDEVFIDATDYLRTYSCTAHELALRMIREVLSETGVTATAGIGTNLFLAKVAMDIDAKHCTADADGVRIAELDEHSYREKLWSHTPLTDFWRVGHGIAARLEAVGIKTMGDLALKSTDPAWEEYLYKTFGVNAELLIDHAWGWEPCTMKMIKAYKPESRSLGSGQVLSRPYSFEEGRVVLMEMADALSLDLFDKKLLTDQVAIYAGYDVEDARSKPDDRVPVISDWYGRRVPKPVNGSTGLGKMTSSSHAIMDAAVKLYDRLVDRRLHVRRLNITALNVMPEDSAVRTFELFEEGEDPSRERRRQAAILAIKKKFGKNAILRGLDYEEGATARERNAHIGGHKA